MEFSGSDRRILGDKLKLMSKFFEMNPNFNYSANEDNNPLTRIMNKLRLVNTKSHPIACSEGTEWECLSSSTLFNLGARWGGQRHVPAALPPGK